jgi:hypothetical protein
VPITVTASLLEYLVAADALMNLEYRAQKLLTFSRTSIIHIHERWGVPEPLNVAVFAVLTLIALAVSKRILGKLLGGKSFNTGSMRFNAPDFSEIGVLVNNVRKLHEEVSEIKKSLAGQGVGGPVDNSNVTA